MCIGLAEHCYLVRIAFEPAKSLLKSGWLFEIDFFPVCKRTGFFPSQQKWEENINSWESASFQKQILS